MIRIDYRVNAVVASKKTPFDEHQEEVRCNGSLSHKASEYRCLALTTRVVLQYYLVDSTSYTEYISYFTRSSEGSGRADEDVRPVLQLYFILVPRVTYVSIPVLKSSW